MNKVITIDGPSASGKGTLAILLAERLNWKILDSGALYRAFAYFSISENDQKLIEQNLRKISFNIVDNSIQVLFKNEDILHFFCMFFPSKTAMTILVFPISIIKYTIILLSLN